MAYKRKDKRKKPQQAANFGLKVKDLTTHGGITYLKYGSHLCKNCILRMLKKCNVYGEMLEINGEMQKVGMNTECPILDEFVSDTVQEIMSLPHIKHEDVILVNQLARAQAFIALGNKYLCEVGLFRIKHGVVDTQPLLNSITKYENIITKLCNELGLSPRTRAQLQLNKEPFRLSDMILQQGEKK